MSDTKTGGDAGSGSPKRGTLSLKGRGGMSTVKQNFSHGRSNSVVVETKKRRIVKPGDEKPVFGRGAMGGEEVAAFQVRF